MIRVIRGAEPTALAPVRTTQLAALHALGRPPTSKDIDGYRIVADELWRAQHFKCCYCEQKIKKGYNDVEHYRPKASANRRPGCIQSHGYWWLAFTWDNLLFACSTCNRSAKNDRFPLDHGSVPLQVNNPPPGNEHPLFLNPGADLNPVEHIKFVLETVGLPGSIQHWWARPRNGSPLGDMTIDVCDLNNIELRELRSDYFDNTIAPQVEALNTALAAAQRQAIQREYDRALQLLNPKTPFVAFTFDALRSSISDAILQAALQKSWPLPSQVGR